MSLLRRFTAHLATFRLQPGTSLVAVSGGVDSVVLLDLLVRTRHLHGLDLVVAHVDHGIHPESAAVAEQVESLASALGVPAMVGRLALGSGASETLARRERYRWLRAAAREAGARWIFTAHHADDQAETVLLRLLHGSGPAGLAGMPRRRGQIVRPLLPFRRSTLVRYASRRGLTWWEDPANRDPRHFRSWLRLELLPLLERRLPGASRNLRTAGRHAAGERVAWTAALRHWPGVDWRREGRGGSVSWPVLQQLPPRLARSLASAMTRSAGCPAGPARIRRALETLARAQSGARADLGGGWQLELAFDRLRLLPPERRGETAAVLVTGERGETTWGDWQVRWHRESAPERQPREGDTAWFTAGALLIRPWRPGDRLAPLGGRGHRLAVRCFQDARVPRSDRNRWPVIESGGQLAWIPGVCRSDRLVPVPGAPALRMDVSPRE